MFESWFPAVLFLITATAIIVTAVELAEALEDARTRRRARRLRQQIAATTRIEAPPA